MTPNEIIKNLATHGIAAASWQTGGGCGAVGIELQSLTAHLLIVGGGFPYTYGLEEDTDQGDSWQVALYDTDDGGTWIDGNLERDGDAITPADQVPSTVARLISHHLTHLATD